MARLKMSRLLILPWLGILVEAGCTSELLRADGGSYYRLIEVGRGFGSVAWTKPFGAEIQVGCEGGYRIEMGYELRYERCIHAIYIYIYVTTTVRLGAEIYILIESGLNIPSSGQTEATELLRIGFSHGSPFGSGYACGY